MKNNSSSSNLRIPGPTPMSSSVLTAVSQQSINHRGHAYEAMHERMVKNLQLFFQTDNDIFLLTSSGTSGFETTVVNFFSPGDKILSFTCGEFGNRFADCARAFHANVIQVKFPIGSAVSISDVEQTLNSHPDAKGIFFTHNETAVGVLNNLKSILPIVHAHPNQPLVCVDAVSSLGGVDLPMDNLGIDVLFTGSQKCWMAPPGICMLSVSKKAWEFHKSAKNPRYYFDLDFFKKFDEKNQTPSTPALATLFGLDASLSHMAEVGRDAVFSHHQTLMHHTRNKIKKMGMKLFVADEDASPTVTSIALPVGNDGSGWLKELRETHHVVLAGGMGEAKGKILRIAHMGYAVKKEEIDQALEALEKVASRKE